MNGFKQIITVLSAVFIFFGAIEFLGNKSKMEKPLKYILSLVMMLVILGAVFGIKNLDIDITTPHLSRDYTIQKQTYKTQSEYLIGAVLKDNSIEFSKVNVKVDILQDGSIIISEVEVVTKQNAEQVGNIIKGHFDVLKVSVVNE